MDAIDISYRLKRLGKTQTQIARDLGVRQGVVSNVIHDRATAYRVASHIASLLGMRVEELWPDRYCFKPRMPMRRARPVQLMGEAPKEMPP
ncbi:helix-turn-helix domain-containing protein [Comamonas odontotermitis]|uniref:helix-turn-helix domain-containing protein n=1 Tax=Comamonas odontotermitis TaxID=379895 RepID=UPI00366ED819